MLLEWFLFTIYSFPPAQWDSVVGLWSYSDPRSRDDSEDDDDDWESDYNDDDDDNIVCPR